MPEQLKKTRPTTREYDAPSRGWWNDTTRNPITGHYIGKDLRQNIAFLLGCFLLAIISPVALLTAMFSKTGVGIVLPWEPGAMLVVSGLGYGGLKTAESFLNRKTADAYGQPLTQPGTAPPKPMPQVPNPNAPAAADANEVDGADGPSH